MNLWLKWEWSKNVFWVVCCLQYWDRWGSEEGKIEDEESKSRILENGRDKNIWTVYANDMVTVAEHEADLSLLECIKWD